MSARRRISRSLELRNGRNTVARVIPDEIAKALTLAGFDRIQTEESSRHRFTRRQCTLVINHDATWACHWQAADVKRRCCAGYSFASLLDYLRDYGQTDRATKRDAAIYTLKTFLRGG